MLRPETYLRQSIDARNIAALYDRLFGVITSSKYEDSEWEKLNEPLRDPRELSFLYLLCWGNYTQKGQLSQWNRVRNNFSKYHRALHELSDEQKESLGYFLSSTKDRRRQWPTNFLKNLVRHLRSRGLTFDEFCERLGSEPPEHAKIDLMNACNASSSKIVECFLRDVLKIDSFPIDMRIREVLDRYHVPRSSRKIVDCCRQLNIDPRIFNRAIYREYKWLIKRT